MLRNLIAGACAVAAVLLLVGDAEACGKRRTASSSYASYSDYSTGYGYSTGYAADTYSATPAAPGYAGGGYYPGGGGYYPGGGSGYNPGGLGGPASGLGVRPGVGFGGFGPRR
jgi:hypothetical protein